MTENGELQFWAELSLEGAVPLPGGGWAFVPDENYSQEPLELGPEWVDMGFVDNDRG